MIALLRSVVAVVVGYVLFAALAQALFVLSGRPAHAPASVPFMAPSAVLGGWVRARRERR